MSGHFSLCGEGLCIGYDSSDAVERDETRPKFEFTWRRHRQGGVRRADPRVESHLAAAMARD